LTPDDCRRLSESVAALSASLRRAINSSKHKADHVISNLIDVGEVVVDRRPGYAGFPGDSPQGQGISPVIGEPSAGLNDL
jgi:hypothetical protein